MEAKDIIQLAVSALAPFVAIWVAGNQWRERIAGYTAYVEGEDPEGYPEAYPSVGVHNRSNQAIILTAVTFASGIRRKLNLPYTALLYEDPTDLSFPYRVDPGATWDGVIDLDEAKRLRASLCRLERLLCRLSGRGSVSVMCKTSAGSRLAINVDEMLA